MSLNWHRIKDGMMSDDGLYKITNSGPKGGNRYCLWTLYEWDSPDGKFSDFVRLVRMGTLDECKR